MKYTFLFIFIAFVCPLSAQTISKDPLSLIPKEYVVWDTLSGDLNYDGTDDLIYIIKGTDTSFFVQDEDRGMLDQNRRGLIILFRKKDQFEKVLENYSCFSSDNEDGGVYYPPELEVSIKKGKLYVYYMHGRYGYWGCTFRYQQNKFVLIGYDQSDNMGPLVNRTESINFLTKKRITRTNTNVTAEGGDEVFKTKTSTIKLPRLILLSEIKDFFDLSAQWME